MHLVFYSPQTLPSIGGLQYVVHYWAEALSKRGHTITVITETPSTEAGDTPSPFREKVGEEVETTSTEAGDTPSPLRGRVGEEVETPSTEAGDTPSPLRGRVGEEVETTSTEAGDTPSPLRGRVGEGAILRRASFFQQVRAMRKADKIILFNVSLKGLPAILLSGKPFYVSHHTALWYADGPRPLRQRLKQWVANYLAKDNCACSGFIASLYKKCRVIYSPYRPGIFVPGHQQRKPGSILFAGRLVSDKGADLLIEAFAKLVQEGLDITLTIVGDGPEREKLQAQAVGLGLKYAMFLAGDLAETEKEELLSPGPATNCQLPTAQLPTASLPTAQLLFHPSLPQPQLVRQMQTHQIMVVPSRMEPMGMIVAEGLASGCRMVVSNQGGMPEVGGPFCRYFENGQVESLAGALREQLSNPLPVQAAMLQKHLEKFTIEYSAGELEKWLGGSE